MYPSKQKLLTNDTQRPHFYLFINLNQDAPGVTRTGNKNFPDEKPIVGLTYTCHSARTIFSFLRQTLRSVVCVVSEWFTYFNNGDFFPSAGTLSASPWARTKKLLNKAYTFNQEQIQDNCSKLSNTEHKKQPVCPHPIGEGKEFQVFLMHRPLAKLNKSYTEESMTVLVLLHVTLRIESATDRSVNNVIKRRPPTSLLFAVVHEERGSFFNVLILHTEARYLFRGIAQRRFKLNY